MTTLQPDTILENCFIKISFINDILSFALLSDLNCTCPKEFIAVHSSKNIRAWRYLKSIFDENTTYTDLIKVMIGFKIVFYPKIL